MIISLKKASALKTWKWLSWCKINKQPTNYSLICKIDLKQRFRYLSVYYSWKTILKLIFDFIITEPEWDFAKKLDDVEATEREKAVLQCEVNDKEAEVTWMKGDQVWGRCFSRILKWVL